MRCFLYSACCDCEGHGCGCSGCVSCQLCESCRSEQVYCYNRKLWFTPICEHDDTPATYTTSGGVVVYDK